MAQIKKMVTTNSIVLIYNGKKIVVNRFDDVKAGVPVPNEVADKILAILKDAVNDPSLLNEETSPIIPLIDVNVSLKDSPFYIDKVQCKVYIDETEVDEFFSKKIIQANNEGKKFEHVINFWKRLQLNPSETTKKELYDYLIHNGLPLTKEGYFVSYKTVRMDYYSNFNYREGNPDNVLNKPGTWVIFDRSKVDPNRDRTCSNGLHAANYHYATKEYGSPKCITLIIDPADVVTIPSDYNDQKMRTCAYYVLEDCKGEYKENFIDLDFNLPPKDGKVEEVKVIEEVKAVEPEVTTSVNAEEYEYYNIYKNAVGRLWTFSKIVDGYLIYTDRVDNDTVTTKIKIGDKVFATWEPHNNEVIHKYVKVGTIKKIANAVTSSFSKAVSGFVGDKPKRDASGRFVSNKKSAFGQAVSSFIGKNNLPKRGPDGKFLKKES